MRILVGYDGSPGAAAAVDEVLRRPWPPGTEVRLVTVVDPPVAFPPAEGLQAYVPLIEKARAVLRDEMERLVRGALEKFGSRPDLKTSYEIREPGVKRALLDAIQEWRADLVMVGFQGMTAVGRFFLGSVSHALVTHAPCSVEVVKTPAAR
jgi:nucleotide-binding universal stress UspA family protein